MIFEFINLVYNTNSVFYMVFAYTLLFYIGVFGIILNRKGYLITIMAIEIILLSVALLFLGYSLHLDDATGQVFVILILAVSAAESAISLALLVLYFRSKGSIVFQKNKRISYRKN